MTIKQNFSFRDKPLKQHLRSAGLFTLSCACAAGLHAQSATNWLASAPVPSHALLFGANTSLPLASSSADTEPAFAAQPEPAAFPEAPLPQLAMDPKPKHGTDPSEHIAQKWTMSIPADWHAQRLTPGEKVKAGLTDVYSFQTIASWFLSAGWEQLLNGSPNYGTDKGAFGQRLGAAALRGTSQNVFSEVILAPILHEDARYYVDGPSHSLVHRTVYAITRPLITRTDSGKSTVNASLLLGYAGAAALTPTYYPQINRNFHDVASVFGGGVGGAALGYFITEFSQDALRAVHLSRKP